MSKETQVPYSVLNVNSNNMGLPFFGDSVSIQRYDKVAWPFVQKWYEKGLAQFWRPEEIDVTKDKLDFQLLDDGQKHIFLSNLKRQIMLDTIQGRAPIQAFGPIASTPEMEFAVLEWTRQEAIHSLSYTHIIRGVLNDPSEVFDKVLEIEEIVDCAADISLYYDDIIRWSGAVLSGRVMTEFDNMNHKRAFWRALFAANALEGIRFYVSFACSWAFPKVLNGSMTGNASIIRLIARDEQDHLMLTQTLINRLPSMDPDFAIIREELRHEVTEMFMDVVQQEKEWAKYLFKEGTMLGLNYDILSDFIDWLATVRMAAIGHPYPGNAIKENPMAWINEYLNNAVMQYALQEVESTDYLHGITTGSVNDGLIDRRKH